MDIGQNTPPVANEKDWPARVLIFTGDGKGKTTAALGVAMRTMGHGRRVRVAQFFKSVDSGELTVLRSWPGVSLLRDGLGFPVGEQEPHRLAAARLWERVEASEAVEPSFLLILDEICLAVNRGMVEAEAVAALLRTRSPESVTIMTGRDAPPSLVELADTITEMHNTRHAYDQGRPAGEGVEY